MFSPHALAWAELLEEKEAGSSQGGVAGMSTVGVDGGVLKRNHSECKYVIMPVFLNGC